jgi:putative CocE/NonD family hydrolase
MHAPHSFQTRRVVVVATAVALLVALIGAVPSRAALPSDAWPAGLHGPFEVRDQLPLSIPMDDGVTLDGCVLRPALPAGVRAPVVLWSGPYFGEVFPGCDNDLWHTDDDPTGVSLPGDPPPAGEVPVMTLVHEGYAVAMVNIRGTGNSGGCLDPWSPREQHDQALLVEALAAMPWTNARIGMIGVSYNAGTAMEAAIENPPHLKTILIGGIMTDIYQLESTPNGAAVLGNMPTPQYRAGWLAPVTYGPFVGPSGTSELAHLGVMADRRCGLAHTLNAATSTPSLVDHRDAAFYGPRDFLPRMDRVTASVFMTGGFQDWGHRWQEDVAWKALRKAPKHMAVGNWGHQFPNQNGTIVEFRQQEIEWFDYWLKELGPAPATLGRVDYQAMTGEWSSSTAWPPAEAKDRVLYLGQDTASATRTVGDRSFVSTPAVRVLQSEDFNNSAGPMCDPTGTHAVVYTTGVLGDEVDVAGNPFAWLRLKSDQPGGLVRVTLADIGPDFACTGTRAQDFKVLSFGTADLRYDHSSYDAIPFPVNEDAHVRVDLSDVAARVPAGHRIAIIVGASTQEYENAPVLFTPTIVVRADGRPDASQIVLPVVSDSLLGTNPATRYAPRPWTGG